MKQRFHNRIFLRNWAKDRLTAKEEDHVDQEADMGMEVEETVQEEEEDKAEDTAIEEAATMALLKIAMVVAEETKDVEIAPAVRISNPMILPRVVYLILARKPIMEAPVIPIPKIRKEDRKVKLPKRSVATATDAKRSPEMGRREVDSLW